MNKPDIPMELMRSNACFSDLFDIKKAVLTKRICGWGGVLVSKMRFFIILSCVLIFLFEHSFLLSNATAAGNDCLDDIAGYWQLNEAATGSYVDAIGNNTGTCVGSACPDTETGQVSQGKSFDGGDTITMSADTGGFNWAADQSFTIELWMRRDTGTINGGFEAFIGRADAAGLNWYIGINSSGNAQAWLKAADGSGPGALTVSKDLRSDPADPNGSTWHHVALVRNATSNTTTLYVDGELSTSQTHAYSANFVSATAPMTLGSLDGANSFSDGGLDEVAIYDRELGQDEIRSHYYIVRDYCSFYDSAVTIMPMGDSITSGVQDGAASPQTPLPAVRTGYRFDLWELLGNNLYRMEYNGSQQEGGDNFDNRHAGFTGIRDDQLFELLNTGTNPQPGTGGEITTGPYLESYPTEIILLHIGTNGLDTNTDDVDNILDEIDEFSKNVTVLLAQIIDLSPGSGTVTAFNTAIAGRAAERIDAGDKIIMVNMESGAEFDYRTDTGTSIPNPNGDMYDTYHPNSSGYNKMAGKWFETLETILPQSETPVITSTAITAASRGEMYTYTVTATGPPSPTFELTDNPAPGEMTIDSVSGLIQWTPDTVGDFDVTVRASNWAGDITQAFTISVTVNSRPQAMGDAYSGVLEGETLTVTQANGVLSNDEDGENDPLSTVLVSDVTHGTLTLDANGAFTYTHDGSENFSDSFSYKASDGKAESDAVVVTLTITPVDDPITPGSSGGGGGGGGCFITALN